MYVIPQDYIYLLNILTHVRQETCDLRYKIKYLTDTDIFYITLDKSITRVMYFYNTSLNSKIS